MNVLAAKVIDQAGEALGGFLPRAGGALLLLVLGLLITRLVARLLQRALERLGSDELAERWGVAPVLESAGLGRSLARLLARVARIGLTLVIVFAALSLLGLQFLSESLNAAVLLLPKLLVGAALVLAGVVLGALVRERVERAAYQMDFPVPLGRAAQVIVVGIFAITAAAQIAVSTAILMVLVSILLAGAAATFALSFGLGGRDIARQLSAGRYVRGSYAVGQWVSFAEIAGEIVAIDSVTSTIRTEDGRSQRFPNSLLLESVVTLREAPPGA
jgi:small-conductance mechanosensitive channel